MRANSLIAQHLRDFRNNIITFQIKGSQTVSIFSLGSKLSSADKIKLIRVTTTITELPAVSSTHVFYAR